MTDSSTLTHVGPEGGVRMVDVAEKSDSVRTAVAAGAVELGEAAFQRVKAHDVEKGDVLTVAQIAGIMGAKQTSKLIPLCHDVQVEGVEVDLTLNEERQAIDIRAYAKSIGVTGVEMEALTAVSIAGLTVYDMCKSISKDLRITDIRLLAKTGGQSGNYRRREFAEEEDASDNGEPENAVQDDSDDE
jgi:cyclic pyranopterin phosphate synthase